MLGVCLTWVMYERLDDNMITLLRCIGYWGGISLHWNLCLFENVCYMKYDWYDALEITATFGEIKWGTCLIVRLWGGDMACVSENVGTVQGRIKVEVHGWARESDFSVFEGADWAERELRLSLFRSSSWRCGSERSAAQRHTAPHSLLLPQHCERRDMSLLRWLFCFSFFLS